MSERVIVVTGTRHCVDAGTARALRIEIEIADRILVGDAAGIDRLAASLAEEMGISVERFRADWKAHGRGAGPVRNAKVTARAVELTAAGAAVTWSAFPAPDSSGTWDCVRRLARAGIPGRVIPARRPQD